MLSFRDHAGPTKESTRDEPCAANWPAYPTWSEFTLACVGARSTLELDDSRKWRMKSNHLRSQDSWAWEK